MSHDRYKKVESVINDPQGVIETQLKWREENRYSETFLRTEYTDTQPKNELECPKKKKRRKSDARKSTDKASISPSSEDYALHTVVEVGGPRNERKKWMHCFSHIDSMIFVLNTAGFMVRFYPEKLRFQKEFSLTFELYLQLFLIFHRRVFTKIMQQIKCMKLCIFFPILRPQSTLRARS